MEKWPMQAPFNWFGNKARVADEVWKRFGKVKNYIEPFFGSGGVFLNCPYRPIREIICDKDGFICNFWRAVQKHPKETASWAQGHMDEHEKMARHIYCVQHMDGLSERLMADPDYCDVRIAGYWVFVYCLSIGGAGVCTGKGPWWVEDGKFGRFATKDGLGIIKQRPAMGKAGIFRAKIGGEFDQIHSWFEALSKRLSGVVILGGDWSRALTDSVMNDGHKETAVFLDPPYSTKTDFEAAVYRESSDITERVREWALPRGDNPKYRIALCDYIGVHDEELLPRGWVPYRWASKGGYANKTGGKNRNKEVVWFSPHCFNPEAVDLDLDLHHEQSDIEYHLKYPETM